MSTVPASNRLAALQRNILVAVAAFVVHGAGGGVDGDGVLRGGVGVVLLGGHLRERWAKFVARLSRGLVEVGSGGGGGGGGESGSAGWSW
jgi:hypothetical protein